MASECILQLSVEKPILTEANKQEIETRQNIKENLQNNPQKREDFMFMKLVLQETMKKKHAKNKRTTFGNKSNKSVTIDSLTRR